MGSFPVLVPCLPLAHLPQRGPDPERLSVGEKGRPRRSPVAYPHFVPGSVTCWHGDPRKETNEENFYP